MTAAIHQNETYSKTLLGFWIYLMTDCILFGILFAAYAVLHNNAEAHQLFDLRFALTETFILLFSSFTCGLAGIAARANNRKQVFVWFAITFLLGIAFIGMELSEFNRFVNDGNSWQKNAFLSSFFTLVGTHGLHISIGLLWMIVLLIPVMRRGLTPVSLKRLTCLRLFWHFLDVVWIFIFTLVYLMGGI